MDEWVKVPTGWIRAKDNPLLRTFSWQSPDKSDYIAALMLYICIAQNIERKEKDGCPRGWVRLSYSQLNTLTSLSRSKVSAGLSILRGKNLIEINTNYKTNVYTMVGYINESGWAKLPAKRLYDKKCEQIKPFLEFKLRQRVELDALKLYLMLIAFRDNQKNHATPSYETISKYTGIPVKNIRSSISLLVNHDMIHVQKYGDLGKIDKRNNFYRIIGIDGFKHAGNTSYDNLFQIK